MYPVLFDLDLGRLGQFTIGTYGLFYALGFLLALRVAIVYARRDQLPVSRIVDLGILTLIAGFIGAKLLLYILDADYYLQHPMEIFRTLRSAGVFYGGFVLAALTAVLYMRRYHLPMGRVADLASPALAIGQGLGRLGCFFAGCCYGRVCELPWAVTFSETHPSPPDAALSRGRRSRHLRDHRLRDEETPLRRPGVLDLRPLVRAVAVARRVLQG
jgi:phosphatidylglycerol:prolipoprotein diacylglycerol transferase